MRWPHVAATAGVCVLCTYAILRASREETQSVGQRHAETVPPRADSVPGQAPQVAWERVPSTALDPEPTPASLNPSPLEFETATEEREHIIRRISDGGSSPEEWHRDAMTAIDAIRTSVVDVGAKLSEVQCYYGGCIVHFDYPDLRSFDAGFGALDDAPSLLEWTRAVTGPEHRHDSGRVANALVLFRPQHASQHPPRSAL